MILVIGGMAAGKRTFVKSLGYQESQMADGVLNSLPVLYNLQDLVAKNPEPEAVNQMVSELLKKQVIVCNEVGSGVVPVDRNERLCREQTGRLCVLLAREATRVVRVVCGIPMMIKETQE